MGIFNIFKKPPSKNARQPPKRKTTTKAATKKTPSTKKPAPKSRTQTTARTLAPRKPAAQNPKARTAASLSKLVPWGRTLSTNDNLTSGSKTGSKKPRPLVVIDNNKKNDLAVVSLTKTPGKDRTKLPKYQNGKSYFKHYVEIEDTDGNSIRVNDKFRANHKNMDVSKEDVQKIRHKVFEESKQKQRNQKLIEKLKK